ncbi:MAG: hypothetical protein IJ889_05415 [Eubacterium sp.]|nr:hypothetical protein [Eubacterium sp.]
MKKIVCLICVIALMLSSINMVSAKAWSSYFGLNKGWYEGMGAKMTSNSSTGWTVKVTDIGWGGCWGGQVYRKGLSIKKGEQYNIKFTIKSTKLDKWVWVKIGNTNGKKMNFGKWLNCKKGKTVTVNETFTAKYNDYAVWFGIGGDFGDRAGVKTDKDAKVRYKYAPNKKLDSRLGSDAAAKHPTVITVSGFHFRSTSGSYVTVKKGLSKKLFIMNKGHTRILKFKGSKKKVKWKTTNKKVLKIYKAGKNKIIIYAKKRGTAKVIAKLKKKKYTCKVAVF